MRSTALGKSRLELQHTEDDKDGHADPLAVLQVEDSNRVENDCQTEAEGVDMAAIAVRS